jgi:hypothetical protein
VEEAFRLVWTMRDGLIVDSALSFPRRRNGSPMRASETVGHGQTSSSGIQTVISPGPRLAQAKCGMAVSLIVRDHDA